MGRRKNLFIFFSGSCRWRAICMILCSQARFAGNDHSNSCAAPPAKRSLLRFFRSLVPILFFSSVFSPAFADSTPAICPQLDAAGLFKKSLQMSEEAQNSHNLRDKAKLAEQGVDFANQCLETEKQNVGCLYYRAVNRGLYLETKILGVKEGLNLMMDDFISVTRLQPSYDQGGAFRALGTVYLRLPSVPILGTALSRDLDKAWNFTQKALAVAPNEAGNLLLAGEIAIKKEDEASARSYFNKSLTAARLIQNPDHDDRETLASAEKWLKKLSD